MWNQSRFRKEILLFRHIRGQWLMIWACFCHRFIIHMVKDFRYRDNRWKCLCHRNLIKDEVLSRRSKILRTFSQNKTKWDWTILAEVRNWKKQIKNKYKFKVKQYQNQSNIKINPQIIKHALLLKHQNLSYQKKMHIYLQVQAPSIMALVVRMNKISLYKMTNFNQM